MRRLEAALATKGRKLAIMDRSPPPEPGPRRSKSAARLAAALAGGRVTAERVAWVLRVRPQDVPAIAEGRVRLGSMAWRRLLRELGL
jgi:hypothetical protein